LANRLKLADLVAEAKLDNDKFLRELQEIRNSVDRRTDEMVKEFRKVESKGTSIFKRFASGAVGALSGIATFFAARGIFTGFQKMISLASDTTESMNKVKEVFGGAADEVIKFSDNAATSLGATRQEALAMTGEIGNLLVAMGANGEEAASMSTKVTQLAADLGSFNNVPTVEALDAIRAALVGETEPIRRFGSDIRVARLEQLALAKGIDKSRLATDSYLKAQLSLEAVFQDTKKAQGDFNRTANDWANLQKTITALVSDAAAKLGTALIPKLTEFARIVKEFLTGDRFDVFLENLTKRFDQISSAIAPVVKGMIDFVNAADAEKITEIRDEIDFLQKRLASLQGVSGSLNKLFGHDVDSRIAETKARIKELNGELLALVTVTESDIPGGKKKEKEDDKSPVNPEKAADANQELKNMAVNIDAINAKFGDDISKRLIGRLADLDYIDLGDIWKDYNDNIQAADAKTKDLGSDLKGVAGQLGTAFKNGQNLGKELLKIALQFAALKLSGPIGIGASFLSGALKHGGGGTITQSGGFAKAQFGLAGTVPTGFPRDNFLIGVSSGERVNVETPQQAKMNDRHLQAILAAQQATNANISQLARRQDNIEAIVNVTDSDLEVLVRRAEVRRARFL
jgi:hypothetical protein